MYAPVAGAVEPETEAVVLAPVLSAQVDAGARAPPGGVKIDLQHIVGGHARDGVVGDNGGIDINAAAKVAVREPGARQAALEIIEDGGIVDGLGECKRPSQGCKQK